MAAGKMRDEKGHLVYSGFFWKLARPRVILAVNGLLVAAALWFACFFRGLDPGSVGLGTLAGLGIWTLFEYVLHRWILHHKRIPFLRRILWGALHREHHGIPTMREPEYHSIDLAITFPIILVVLGLATLQSRTGFGLAIAGGWALGFCAYEWIHMVTHTYEPGTGVLRIPYLRYLYEVHQVHHHVNASRDYGFVTMFWDRCFRTFLSPKEAAEKSSRESTPSPDGSRRRVP